MNRKIRDEYDEFEWQAVFNTYVPEWIVTAIRAPMTSMIVYSIHFPKQLGLENE